MDAMEQIESVHLKRGDEMGGLLLIIGACAVVMFWAVWIYNKADETAYVKVSTEMNDLKAEISSVKKAGSDYFEATKENAKKIIELEGEIDSLQEHCAKLREGQVGLNDKLGQKAVKIEGPISVEVYQRPPAPIKVDNQTPKFDPNLTAASVKYMELKKQQDEIDARVFSEQFEKRNKKKPLGRGIKAVLKNQ